MNLDATLEQLSVDPDAPVDLAEVSLHLARDEYPAIDVDAYLSRLDALAEKARPRLGHALAERVNGLCQFLFGEAGFTGNQSEYYDPRNSYLNDVLDRRTGIPITLSLVAMAIGERLGMTVDGVALPGHFVAMAHDGRERIVFDPFDSGRRLAAGDCESLVREASGIDLSLVLDKLVPASPGTIAVRMLTNLKGAHLRTGDFRRAARVIGRLRQIAPTDWLQARDLGACLLQGGHAGRAIDALELYQREMPDALDKEAVEKLLRRAHDEVARWN